MRRIKKTLLSLALAAFMVMGEAGITLASENEMTADTETAYEVNDPKLNKDSVAVVNELIVKEDGIDALSIEIEGYGTKFDIYVNDVFYDTYNNPTPGYLDIPAPFFSREIHFRNMIQGADYTVRVIPYSYSASGDVAGTSMEKTVSTIAKTPTKLNISMRSQQDKYGYKKPYVWLSVSGSDSLVEIWRKESKGAWTKLGEGDHYYYDYTICAGKAYKYRVRTIGGKNAYASVKPGAWVTSEIGKASVPNCTMDIDYTDYVVINVDRGNNSQGVYSGYEIWRSTKKDKGYKKVATVSETKYTDKAVKSGTYYYKARCYYYNTATGKKIYGAFTDIKTVKVLMGDINLSVKRTAKDTVNIEWNRVNGAQKYEVWYKSDLSGDGWKLYKTTKKVSCNVSKLSDNTRYYFRVKAIKGNGAKTYVVSRDVTYTMGYMRPIPGVSKIKIIPSTLNDTLTIKSTIKWNRIYGADKIRIVATTGAHYEDGVYVPRQEKVIKTLKGSATSYTLTTKVTAENKGYTQIAVVAVKGDEEFSSTIYSSDYVRLNNATKVTIKRKSATSATISWNAVTGATSYDIYRCLPYEYTEDKDLRSISSYVGNSDGTSYIIEDITPGVNYIYFVVPQNDLVSSMYLHDVVQGVMQVTYNHKLGVTKIKSATNTAARKATIQWSKVTNASKYIVYRATSKNGKYQKVATVKTTTYTDSKLSKGKTYYYKIKAAGTNAAGITVMSSFSKVKAVKIKK